MTRLRIAAALLMLCSALLAPSALKLAERIRRRDEVMGGFVMASVLSQGSAESKARADSLLESLERGHGGDRMVVARICFERALRINPQLQPAKASLDSLTHP